MALTITPTGIEITQDAVMQLTLEEYLAQDAETQALMLKNDGYWLYHERHEGTLTILLYALYDFYVEIFVDLEGSEAKRIEAFGEDTARLEKYH